jgi:serine/threonine protein kinase
LSRADVARQIKDAAEVDERFSGLIPVTSGHEMSRRSEGGFWSYPIIMYKFAPYGDVHEATLHAKFSTESSLEVLTFIRRMLVALRQLHRRGYAHMDVKLENVLAFGSGLYYLSDFGTACHIDEKDRDSVCGTNSYLPPEFWMMSNDNPNDKRDVFALGVAVYQLITCNHFWPVPMWSNLSEDSALLAARKSSGDHVHQRYHNLGAHLERVSYYSDNLEGPLGHKEIILRMLTGMLTQDPHARKSSAELLREFDDALPADLKEYFDRQNQKRNH